MLRNNGRQSVLFSDVEIMFLWFLIAFLSVLYRKLHNHNKIFCTPLHVTYKIQTIFTIFYKAIECMREKAMLKFVGQSYEVFRNSIDKRDCEKFFLCCEFTIIVVVIVFKNCDNWLVNLSNIHISFEVKLLLQLGSDFGLPLQAKRKNSCQFHKTRKKKFILIQSANLSEINPFPSSTDYFTSI